MYWLSNNNKNLATTIQIQIQLTSGIITIQINHYNNNNIPHNQPNNNTINPNHHQTHNNNKLSTHK
jgi:hypothetical protein